jgi:hypothetical protein
MPIYLIEDNIGSNADTVGFPNLSTCMGLVVQTTTRLYGYHVAGQQEPTKIEQFRELITATEPGAQMIRLYGSCYWANRYASLAGTALAPQWEAEMKAIATTLSYAGPVSGFDIGSWYSWSPAAKIALSRIKPGQNTYLEYRRQPTTGKCAIFYKRMAKVDTTSGTLPADMHVERIRRVIGGQGYMRAQPYQNLSVISAGVKGTERNHAEFHDVPEHFIRTFNHR